MKQVITGEGTGEMFPKLHSIILRSCPNLKCFYEGSSGLEFPRLSEITVVNCPVLAAFASSFSSDQKKEMTTNDIESEERPIIPIQPFFSDKAAFLNLERLTITHSKNLEMIWQSKVHADSLSKLKSLRVENCEKLLAVFPSTEVICCISQLGMVDYHLLKKLGDDMAEQSTCRFLFQTGIINS
ncbi:hypothetical protein SLEP1_g35330 [Rubroshorea leprosula]|uniref:Disease resistance protein At4g27190-like leucine-rich repeats domain-containing protein n=1 Tax=Rubroshorea leprosula TaxID=152421 RepID=A0AAV5KN24_9ROSI|nr:hypothetical protein SLEP1_g35330 [Rubroshorea leprosula]